LYLDSIFAKGASPILKASVENPLTADLKQEYTVNGSKQVVTFKLTGSSKCLLNKDNHQLSVLPFPVDTTILKLEWVKTRALESLLLVSTKDNNSDHSYSIHVFKQSAEKNGELALLYRIKLDC
jgi:hypothetical protein